MTFDEIFSAFYTQYRREATIPDSSDDEYTIGLRMANEAVNRWAHYDNTYWKELFTTLVLEGEGTTLATNVTDYDAPDNFQEAGGFVKVFDSNNNRLASFPIIEPNEVQFKGENSRYAYFTGSPIDGYTLHLNPAPDSSLNGKAIDYPYYKTPTLFTTGTDVTEMSQPYFVVHRMLANEFRATRNPYYNSAKQDAEDVLKTMQLENNSGSWANPWSLPDNSGSVWGGTAGGNNFFQ